MRLFKEEQRFTQTWLIALMGFSALVPAVIVIISYLKDKNSFSTTQLLLTLSVVILAPCLIFIFKLTTRIDEKGIHYQFFPFHLKPKTIIWEAIDSATIRTYDAITEYGGWGLKGGTLWNKRKGTAINVSGNKGIQLQLKNGKKLLIGTQKAQQAQETIKYYQNN